jgi:hypothetical protein
MCQDAQRLLLALVFAHQTHPNATQDAPKFHSVYMFKVPKLPARLVSNSQNYWADFATWRLDPYPLRPGALHDLAEKLNRNCYNSPDGNSLAVRSNLASDPRAAIIERPSGQPLTELTGIVTCGAPA